MFSHIGSTRDYKIRAEQETTIFFLMGRNPDDKD